MASAMIRLTDRIRTQRFAVLRKPGSLEDCRVERAVLNMKMELISRYVTFGFSP